MQAITFSQYGAPHDVLKLQNTEKPVPKDNEVLIKVRACAANPLDWHIMRGAPVLARIEFGLLKPKINRLGVDVAGVVEAVGKDVRDFKVGDAVFGDIGFENIGGFGEYVCASENVIAHKPDNITFEEAAGIPVVAYTALQGLRDTGQIKAGQKVLINGASGGVGHSAVQIAKAYGCEVTGVCSTRNLDMVRSIGADHVVDYTREDFTAQGIEYDLIFDAVGNRSIRDLKRALKPNGIASIAGFTSMAHVIAIQFFGKRGDKKVIQMPTARTDKKDLLFLKELIESGKLTTVVDRCYPLDETADAIAYLETMRARGKVIVTVA